MDDIQGVDDIAKRLAHLPAMSITHDCMEIDLGAHSVTNSEATILPILMALPSLPTWFLGALLARSLSVSDKWPLLRKRKPWARPTKANVSQQPPRKAGKETQGQG